jgi:hypothetical protein
MKRTYSVENGVAKSAMPIEASLSDLRVGLFPSSALLYAQKAKAIKFEGETSLIGLAHRVVSFDWRGLPVKLYLRKVDSAPSAVQATLPLPFPWSPWGDVTVTTKWAAWQVFTGGVKLPTQFTTEINGYTIAEETWTTTAVKYEKGELPPPSPRPQAPDMFAGAVARYRPVEVKPGITIFQGPFNTTVVELSDQTVVIEPVLSSTFAGAFIDSLKGKKPVKTVIPTDDAWPHFGGIRTFAARGAELVVLNHNRPIVNRILQAHFTTAPDELAKNPRSPKIREVDKKLSLGQGPNRMEIYPIGGQGSERMMMIYFPEHELLYASDLLQKQGAGFFYPAYPKELVDAVNREKLRVQTVIGEHLLPIPYSTVTNFVKEMETPKQEPSRSGTSAK